MTKAGSDGSRGRGRRGAGLDISAGPGGGGIKQGVGRHTIHGARPSIEAWLEEIKSSPNASRVGMYIVHNGVVRGTARDGSAVLGMTLSYDQLRLKEVIGQIEARPGVFAVRVWINEGHLIIGDDIMYALVAGDIRENVFAGLEELVRLIKSEVVTEHEIS